MMPSTENRTRHCHGFTLIELLTSVTIALVLSVLATVAFLQVRGVLNRMHVRLAMHNSARFLYQSLSEQMNSLQQDAAMWMETSQDDGSGNGQVSITFLKGKTDEHGFTTNQGEMSTGGEEFSVYQNRCCDLAWSSWRWDQHTKILYAGTNSPPRQFNLASTWAGPNGDYGPNGGGNVYFMNMPQPLQAANPYPQALPLGSSQAALSGNRYGTTDFINDVSDYQNLMNQMSPVIHNVTFFCIQMVLSDGSVVNGDNTQSSTLGFNGNFVDGHVSAAADGSYPFKKRPRLIRMLIDISDPMTKLVQTFSFSFQPPGMLPNSSKIVNTGP
jgi:prepilin-type N-terminal cleavage/methylation domain-containing protein